MKPFSVLCADPPWSFGDKLPGKRRGAARNYATLTLVELLSFPLPPLAPDCYLFLWRVASMPQEALDVVRAWGFTPKTEIVWNKLTARGKAWFGMGRTTRAAHETAIVATRGRPQRRAANVRDVFSAKVPRDGKRYIHSAKPEEFYELVERLATGRYVELFARRQRPGWTCLGNEMAEAAA